MNARAFRSAAVGLGCASAFFVLMASASEAETPGPEEGALSSELPLQTPRTDRLYAEISHARGAHDGFYRGTVIAEQELGQMRAGFNLGGLEVDFGARLQTLIDNRVELVSVVNFTQAGADIVSQSFRDPAGAAMQVGGGAISVSEVTPDGVNLSGLADFSGVALSDANGFTAALHNITREAIVSGVVSNASQRSIQQRIDISVRLNNIGALDAARKRAAILDSFSGILR